jgi:hypothetical protein
MMQSITKLKKAVTVVNGTAEIQSGFTFGGCESRRMRYWPAGVDFCGYQCSGVSKCDSVFFWNVDLDTMGLSPKAVTSF